MTPLEGTFCGEMEYDPDRGGFTGGTCALTLELANFELKVWRGYIYSIDEHDCLSGEFRLDGEKIILEARRHYSYTWETEKRETTKKINRTLIATLAGPEGHRSDAIEIDVDLTESPFALLLLREGASAELTAWCKGERGRRYSAWKKTAKAKPRLR